MFREMLKIQRHVHRYNAVSRPSLSCAPNADEATNVKREKWGGEEGWKKSMYLILDARKAFKAFNHFLRPELLNYSTGEKCVPPLKRLRRINGRTRREFIL